MTSFASNGKSHTKTWVNRLARKRSRAFLKVGCGLFYRSIFTSGLGIYLSVPSHIRPYADDIVLELTCSSRRHKPFRQSRNLFALFALGWMRIKTLLLAYHKRQRPPRTTLSTPLRQLSLMIRTSNEDIGWQSWWNSIFLHSSNLWMRKPRMISIVCKSLWCNFGNIKAL